MITIRQIQKLWNSRAYETVVEQLLKPRPEGSGRLVQHLMCDGAAPIAPAALIMIRLDELSQSYVPLCGELVRVILAHQRSDGGWGDAAVTGVCIRGLLCSQGHGEAINRGLDALAQLQKPEGIWPSPPVRRMPADSFASAFILMQLGDCQVFQQTVCYERAVEWFNFNEPALDSDSRKLWMHAKRRMVPVRQRSLAALYDRSLLIPTLAPAGTKNFWDFSAGLAHQSV